MNVIQSLLLFYHKIKKFIIYHNMIFMDILSVSITLFIIYNVSRSVHENVHFRIYLVFACLITVLSARLVYIWKNREIPKEYKILTKLDLVRIVNRCTETIDQKEKTINKLYQERDDLFKQISELNNKYITLVQKNNIRSEQLDYVNKVYSSCVHIPKNIETDTILDIEYDYIQNLYTLYSHIRENNITHYKIYTDIPSADVYLDNRLYEEISKNNRLLSQINYIITPSKGE